EEVEAARAAAAKRGERLIVIPVLTSGLRERLERADANLAKAKRAMESSCKGGSSSSSCRDATRAHSRAESQLKAVEKKLPQANARNLANAFARLKKMKFNLTSVIISGHDGNGKYYGRLG